MRLLYFFFIGIGWLFSDGLIAQSSDTNTTALLEWVKPRKERIDNWLDKGDLKEAEAGLDSILSDMPYQPQIAKEQIKIGWVCANKGYILGELLGRFPEAREAYQEALKWHRAAEFDGFLTARYIVEPLANIYTRLGDNRTAITLLRHFATVCQREGETAALCEAYNDLGLAYLNMGWIDKAEEAFELGLDLPELSYRTQAILQSNLAQVWLEKGDDRRAYFIATQAEKKLHSAEDFSNRNKYLLGSYQAQLSTCGSWADSAQIEQQWKKVKAAELIAFGSQQHRKRLKSPLAAGRAWMFAGYPERALHYFHQAIEEALPGFSASNVLEAPVKTSGYAESLVMEALQGKMDCLLLLYEQDTARIAYLEAHLKHADFRFLQEVEIRSLLLSKESKYAHLKRLHQDGENAVEVALKLYRKKGQVHWLEQAFAYAEQTKGLLLSESLHPLWNALSKEPSSEALRQVFALEEQRASLMVNWDDAEEGQAAWLDLEQQRAEAWLGLKRDYPDLVAQVYAGHSFDLSAIQNWVVKEDCPVFTSFEARDKIYLFWLSQTGLKVHELAKTSSLTQALAQHSNWLQTATLPNDSAAERAHYLFQQCLEPFQNELALCDQFIVVADGGLANNSFETLLSESTSSNDYRKWPFVARKWSIGYAPSLKLVLRPNRNSNAKTNFSGWAPDFSCSPELANLAVPNETWQALAQNWGGSWNLGADAGLNQFLAAAGESRILHLQTHALAVEDNPARSWLAFQSDSNACELEQLFLAQLYALNLNSDLLVLGACETARGKFAKGDGTQSLSHSFAFSGCRNTVASRWKINPEVSDQILHHFYRHLQKGERLNRCLQRAKLDYLNSEDTDGWSAHPSFWAGLAMIGGGEALEGLESKQSIPLSAGWVVGLFGLVLLFFLFRGRFGGR